MKSYYLTILLTISLLLASCAAPRSIQEEVKENTHNWQYTVDSLHHELQRSEQVIRELNLQMVTTQKRAENNERIIREYDAQGNLIKTDEMRTSSTEENHLQAALSASEEANLALKEENVGLHEALAKASATRQTSTQELEVAYRVPTWCWWLLFVNVLYLAFRLLWKIYGKRFLQLFIK